MLQQGERGPLSGPADGDDRLPEGVLEAQVQACLDKSPYHSLRYVTCRLSNGVLTLQGRVPSYYLKQLAQVLARSRLAGAALVRNKLEVVEAGGSGWGGREIA